MNQPPDHPTSKSCRHCGERKPLEAFYVNRDRRDGHENLCKVCRKELYGDRRGNAKLTLKQRLRRSKRDRERYHSDSEFREREVMRARAWRERTKEKNDGNGEGLRAPEHMHPLQGAE